MTLQVTPRQAVEQLERNLGLTTSELADALETSERSLERWRSAVTYPQRDARRRLESLIALERHLREVFSDPASIRSWLHGDNRYLGGLSPADALRAGRIDRVEAALEALESGVVL
ncbi:MAG TPA: MbcA/ParS/Xre antitoxin family protein [Thermomicrobiaceae bacterium]|nr:MbcA/ParS/Xre antitoxin family protein [Thermomicrobiaceae bacterium]